MHACFGMDFPGCFGILLSRLTYNPSGVLLTSGSVLRFPSEPAVETGSQGNSGSDVSALHFPRGFGLGSSVLACNARGVFADFRVDAPLDFRVDVRFEWRLSLERKGVETTAVAVLAKLVKLPCRSPCAARIVFDHALVFRTFPVSDDKNSRSSQYVYSQYCTRFVCVS